jgi:hypothetical protein|tara:strand:- start:2598 stop:2774 length:177 start_codon:yes stop_codon:yes gene_type:complete
MLGLGGAAGRGAGSLGICEGDVGSGIFIISLKNNYKIKAMNLFYNNFWKSQQYNIYLK